jgi:ABC-type uncharacterized transport system involved in gliding motility auxiliary subunit
MSPKGRLFLAITIVSFLSLGGLFFALRVWMPFMWAIVAPVVIGFIGWLFYERKLLIEFFSLKTTKYGIDMGAIIFLSVLFIAVLNFVGARHTKTFDFSINQVNSLSEQSKKITGSLQTDLFVKFFYKNGADQFENNKKIFRDLVKRYQDINNKIQFEFVEMNEKAKLTQEFAASKGSGEAFIEYKGKKNRIENYTEQDFTNAMIKVTRIEKKTVYFLEGHGERSIDDEKDEASLYGFKLLLQKNSYDVKKLSLISVPEVPNEADVLIIAAPTQGFQEHEVRAIENYLKRGGGVFIALDGVKIPSGFQKILNTVGVDLESFYVFNVFNTPMGQVVNAQSPTVAVIYSPLSEITKVFGPNQMTVFRQPHALKDLPRSEKIKLDYIVKTPESSVALRELDSSDYIGKPQSYNLIAEVKGLYINSEKEFSMVIAADIDFMTNILLYQNLNRDLALNSISALAKDIDLISVTPKETAATKILLSPPEFNQFFKFIVAGIFLPLPFVFMIISLVLWYRRRHA